MPANGSDEPPHARLIRKLHTVADLSTAAIQAVERLPIRLKDVPEGVDLVSEGERPTECSILIRGWVCRYALLNRGQRQIFSFHIAGDMPDLQSLHLRTMDHSVSALTPVRVAMIPHAAIHEAMGRHPDLQTAFWRDTLIDAGVFRTWMAGIGRRTAYARIAHLLCELFVRLRAVGLAGNEGFQLFITQSEIADALGLSSVHVNRVLKELRGNRLLATPGRFVSILDWEGLQAAGEFDPSYLHLRPSRSDEGPV